MGGGRGATAHTHTHTQGRPANPPPTHTHTAPRAPQPLPPRLPACPLRSLAPTRVMAFLICKRGEREGRVGKGGRGRQAFCGGAFLVGSACTEGGGWCEAARRPRTPPPAHPPHARRVVRQAVGSRCAHTWSASNCSCCAQGVSCASSASASLRGVGARGGRGGWARGVGVRGGRSWPSPASSYCPHAAERPTPPHTHATPQPRPPPLTCAAPPAPRTACPPPSPP